MIAGPKVIVVPRTSYRLEMRQLRQLRLIRLIKYLMLWLVVAETGRRANADAIYEAT